jgi:hypothetical protein
MGVLLFLNFKKIANRTIYKRLRDNIRILFSFFSLKKKKQQCWILYRFHFTLRLFFINFQIIVIIN